MQALKTRNRKSHTLAYGENDFKNIMVRKDRCL